MVYGAAAWGTTSKSNFDEVQKVQNLASMIITGAFISTPIQSTETVTGLENLESRRNTKVLVQAAKLKRLENDPMHKGMSEPTIRSLKRTSFLRDARRLERQDPELLQHANKKITSHCSLPAWKENCFQRYETASLASIQRAHKQQQKVKQ